MSTKNTNMDDAPKDRPILLLIEDSWIEAFWHQNKKYNPNGSWSIASFSSNGCGCCSGINDDPVAWAELPA